MPQVARFYDDYKGAQQCWQCPQDGAEDSLQIEVGMARAPLDEQTTELDEFDEFQKQIKKVGLGNVEADSSHTCLPYKYI